MRKPPPCTDCGPDAVHHLHHRIIIMLSWFFSPLEKIIDEVWRLVGPVALLFLFEHVTLGVFRLSTALGLATITREPDRYDSLRTKALWESAKRRGIILREFRLFRMPEMSIFYARANDRIRIFDGLPRRERIPVRSVRWMDNKATMKTRFLATGIPVARGGVARRLEEARAIFSSLTPPVITKPHVGSRSRHTTIHVNDAATLEIAFKRAKQLSPWVIVEEELVGDVYRGTLIGGNVVGVIRREPPHVLSDGKSTIRALIMHENENPKRHGPVFHELPMDAETEAELLRQGYSMDSVPNQDTAVTVSSKVSRSFGASTRDVTDETYPDIIALLERIGEVLGDSLVGVDFIVRDITKSWHEQDRCGVIECNSLPFLDLHHYPLFGTPRDAAGVLWEFVFPSIQSPSIARNSSFRDSRPTSRK